VTREGYPNQFGTVGAQMCNSQLQLVLNVLPDPISEETL
jgi:hypothetical protein